MKKNIHTFILILLATLSHSVVAQNDTLIGILRNADTKIVKRHQVRLGKEKPIKVKTDKHGIFRIPNANLNDTLYIYIKSEQREVQIPVRGYDILNIMLRQGSFTAEPTTMDDPYLVQHMLRQRSKLLSSDTMNKSQIEESGCTDVLCLLQRMSGVIVNGESVRVRGITSLNAGSDPLVIIDGVQGGSLNMSAYDVSEITVLKETTQYGIKGAAGVILIKTTKGN
ncbi:TonB-dependent receptor plug domain-containing protein [Parabacteroides sp. PF5-9]|uniref:TonB-dependent receptor plug domain-containing protein n=1 Tax=Parabacteroides sp. PF5-9 TaxID=1742404 RepID=UPI002475F808|nr:TonB-dependent receptor plug domain-containing protein [Parabacteroides sp. PF5-9]